MTFNNFTIYLVLIGRSQRTYVWILIHDLDIMYAIVSFLHYVRILILEGISHLCCLQYAAHDDLCGATQCANSL